MIMDEETYLGNLKTLKELILDEEKLVTYVSLSKDLCIHVNEAKALLNRVTKEIREIKPKTTINVCYLISGLLDNNCANTTVCSEEDIEALRKTYKLIFYEHVYCVSRGVKGADNVALTAINKFEHLPLCTGLIKANLCIKRTNDEIGKLKSSSNQAVVIESKPKLNISKKQTEKARETTNNGLVTVGKANSEPIIKSKTPSPKKDASVNNNKSNTNNSKNGMKSAKGIAGFFNKMNGDTAKTKVKLENRENHVKVKIEKETSIEAHSSDLITDNIKKEEIDKKPADTSSNNSQQKVKENSSLKLKNNDSNEDINIEEESKTDNLSETPAKIAKSSNKSQNKNTNNSSLKQIKKNAKVDKKRKRVLHVSDSESETEANDPFADDKKEPLDPDSEDEIPPTPSVNTVKITSGIINPKKKRKMVDKTYTDEDGFILTKKEEVYESCSDNEVEMKTDTQEKENVKQVIQVKLESPQKTNSKSKRKKVSPPQKGKQQMMTNFFKKV